MLKPFLLEKTVIFVVFLFSIAACAPLVPDNYLGSSSVQTPQKINGKWITPKLVPVSLTMLNTPEGKLLLQTAMKPKPYQVGAFDSLNVIVWGHPEFSTVMTSPLSNPHFFRAGAGGNTVNLPPTMLPNANEMPSSTAVVVDSDGKIFFPYAGTLKVGGLTVNEIQKIIAVRLSEYVRDPQVTVQVARFRNSSMYVLGEVNMPGAQALTDKPLTLMEALSQAGGINTSHADPTHIYLVRGNYNNPTVYWLNASTPQALLIAEQFSLQEGDIVYVSAAMLNPWNNFVQQIMPNLTTYVTIKGLANQ